MPRRATLALVRAPSFRPSLSLPRVRRPSLRALAVALAVAVGIVLAYAVARETPVFAVTSVELEGETPAVATDVRPFLKELEGESLVALDRGDVERRLEKIPSVRDAKIDRAFPHTLSIAVVPERPLAVIRDGERAWVIAETGRVIREIDPSSRRRLARIRTELDRTPRIGATLAAGDVRASLRVLDAVGQRLAPGVRFAFVKEGNAELVLRDWLTLRLGPPLDLAAKVAAADAVLRSLTPEERVLIKYLDASAPERVVAGTKSQPVSES